MRTSVRKEGSLSDKVIGVGFWEKLADQIPLKGFPSILRKLSKNLMKMEIEISSLYSWDRFYSMWLKSDLNIY